MEADVKRMLAGAVAVLAVTAAGYGRSATPSFGSDIVGKCQLTLSAPAARAIAEEAKQQGMTVALRPIPLDGDPASPFNFPAFFVGNAGSMAIQGCARMFSAAQHRT